MKKLLSALFALSICLTLALPAYGAPGLKPTNGNSYIVTRHFTVVNKDGENLYSSPERTGRVLAALEYGTQITTTRRFFDSRFDSILTDWYYTVVDGVGGWIDCSSRSVGFAKNVKYGEDVPAYTGEVKAIADCPVYDCLVFDEAGSPDGKVIAAVPAGTLLSFDLYCPYAKCVYGRVEYDGKEGWVAVDGIACDSAVCSVDGYIMTAGAKPLYEDAGYSSGGKAQGTAQAFRVYRYDMSVYGEDDAGRPEKRYRISCDDGFYWICVGNNDYDCVYNGGNEIQLSGGASFTIYSSPDTSSEKAGKIPEDSKYIQLFSVELFDDGAQDSSGARHIWDYIKYENSFGWIERIYSFPDLRVVTEAEYALKDLTGIPGMPGAGQADSVAQEENGSASPRLSLALICALGAVAAACVIAALCIAVTLRKKNH